MAKVYIVTGHVESEGDWIEQVFATEELAKQNAEILNAGRNRNHTDLEYVVEEWEVWSV